MKDNLFDNKVTPLDVIKILLLIVTGFSTWNVVTLMTPPGSLSFIREAAAVGVVEGAFLGFEFATSKAKSARQAKLATVGFFCSLAVIITFAALSGLLEFGGDSLLDHPVGTWLGLEWSGRYAVMALALGVLVTWLGGLAAIYRLYSLADPDKLAELQKIALSGEVEEEARKALKLALDKAKPVIARTRAEAHVMAAYQDELTQDQMNRLIGEVSSHLANHYGTGSPQGAGAQPIPADPEMPIIPDARQYSAEAPNQGEKFRGEGSQAD